MENNNKSITDNCRYYLCESIFGQNDKCIRFNDFLDYINWSQTQKLNKDKYNTVLVPICNCNEKFDRLLLMTKSIKFKFPIISDNNS
jgi:hypothetical protein